MFCTHCGHELSPEDKFCTGCGAPVDGPEPSYEGETTRPFQNAPASYDNHAAADRASRQVPGRFNWGAFSLTLIWGIGNRCYITLLCLVPIVGFVMPFVAGFKGNAWAYENNRYRDMEEFSQVQDTWNRAGFVCFIAQLLIGGFWLFFALLSGITLFTAPYLGDI